MGEAKLSLPQLAMASLLTRNIVKIARNNTLISAARCYSDVPYVEPHKGKVPSDKIDMADELGHAVGPHRWEILAKMAGNDDPYDMKHHSMGACGTREILILSPLPVTKGWLAVSVRRILSASNGWNFTRANRDDVAAAIGLN